jgi:hypothetical protein
MSGENARVQNCDWIFSFQCPQQWEQLAPTEEANVRMCGVCLKNVYLCASDDEVARHAAIGNCVAIPPDYEADYRNDMLLGEVVPNE